ncbi:unnamed protein product, partial [Didymodactylos carnosus]
APLLLQFPNDKYPLILSTDASNKGISGILRQEIDDQNIQQVIHIKGRHNCLSDYFSRNQIQEEDELMNTDLWIGN